MTKREKSLLLDLYICLDDARRLLYPANSHHDRFATAALTIARINRAITIIAAIDGQKMKGAPPHE